MSLHELIAETITALRESRDLYGPAPTSTGFSTDLGAARDNIAAAPSWSGESGETYTETKQQQTNQLGAITDADQHTTEAADGAAAAAAEGRAGMNTILTSTQTSLAGLAPAATTGAGQEAIVGVLRDALQWTNRQIRRSEAHNKRMAARFGRAHAGYQQAAGNGPGSPSMANLTGMTGLTGSTPNAQRYFGGATHAQPAGHATATVPRVDDPGDRRAVARYIYQAALGRGYTPQQAVEIVAYSVGESGLDPQSDGGVQGDDRVLGLFQEKTAFAAAGGVDPSLRGTVEGNVTAYLNQLEAHRDLPMAAFGVGNGALATTSVGGPLSGVGAQDWGSLMARAREYLGM